MLSLKCSLKIVERQGGKTESNYRTTEGPRVALATRSEKAIKPFRCHDQTRSLS
jgi:hypothetical protein